MTSTDDSYQVCPLYHQDYLYRFLGTLSAIRKGEEHKICDLLRTETLLTDDPSNGTLMSCMEYQQITSMAILLCSIYSTERKFITLYHHSFLNVRTNWRAIYRVYKDMRNTSSVILNLLLSKSLTQPSDDLVENMELKEVFLRYFGDTYKLLSNINKEISGVISPIERKLIDVANRNFRNVMARVQEHDSSNKEKLLQLYRNLRTDKSAKFLVYFFSQIDAAKSYEFVVQELARFYATCREKQSLINLIKKEDISAVLIFAYLQQTAYHGILKDVLLAHPFKQEFIQTMLLEPVLSSSSETIDIYMREVSHSNTIICPPTGLCYNILVTKGKNKLKEFLCELYQRNPMHLLYILADMRNYSDMDSIIVSVIECCKFVFSTTARELYTEFATSAIVFCIISTLVGIKIKQYQFNVIKCLSSVSAEFDIDYSFDPKKIVTRTFETLNVTHSRNIEMVTLLVKKTKNIAKMARTKAEEQLMHSFDKHLDDCVEAYKASEESFLAVDTEEIASFYDNLSMFGIDT